MSNYQANLLQNPTIDNEVVEELGGGSQEETPYVGRVDENHEEAERTRLAQQDEVIREMTLENK